MLQSIFLVIIPCLEFLVKTFVRLLQILDRSYAPRIVGGDRGPAETLAQDAVAGAEAERVVG